MRTNRIAVALSLLLPIAAHAQTRARDSVLAVRAREQAIAITRTLDSIIAPVSVTPTPPPDTVVPPPIPTPGTRLLDVDWSTALGNTTVAITDGGRLNQRGGNGGSVVTAASTGLPWPAGMANVLRATSARGEGWTFAQRNNMPTIAAGETRYYRAFFTLNMPASSDNQSHPIQDANAGSGINWEISIRHDATDRPDYVFQFQFHTNNGWPWQHINLRERLRENTIYRIEWAVARVSDTQFTLDPRIYDVAGNLLYQAADFVSDGAPAQPHSATRRINFNNIANTGGLNVGVNQSDWTDPGTFYGYQAGVCVQRGSWCGPYRPR